MPRVNLAQLAKENEAGLRERYEAMVAEWAAKGTHQSLLDFHEHCSPIWRVSMNCDWRGLAYFLDHGMPYNMYRFNRDAGATVDLSQDACIQGETPIDWDLFEQKVSQEWAARRRKFNEYAHLEEDFTYGAYYLDGPGLERYGKQMVLLKREFLKSSTSTSYLLADSLQWYVSKETPTSGAEILKDDLCRDLATYDSVTLLLCLKKADELQQLGHDLCLETVTRDSYIEAQIPDKIDFSAVERVRIRALAAEELEIFADLITNDDVVKAEELDTQEKKNAYYYMLFSTEFPKKGLVVEDF